MGTDYTDRGSTKIEFIIFLGPKQGTGYTDSDSTNLEFIIFLGPQQGNRLY